MNPSEFARRVPWLTLLGALLLPVTGSLLGRALTFWPIGSLWTTMVIVFCGTILGLVLAPIRLRMAILAAALVQQGLMAAILYGQPPMAGIDGDAAAYFLLPWVVLIQISYAVAFLLPGIAARWVLHRARRARERPGPNEPAHLEPWKTN